MIIKLGQDIKSTDFSVLIESIDLLLLSKFIIGLKYAEWVPDVYFKYSTNGDEIYIDKGVIHWSIFSYLSICNLLLIENQYSKTKDDFYVSYVSYYNPLESLYQKIVVRLEENKWLIRTEIQHNNLRGSIYSTEQYTLSTSNIRNKSLEKLGI